MACPICGERCRCPRELEGSSRAALLDPQPGNEPIAKDLPQHSLYAKEEIWRQEVASRVEAFCARRGRKRLPRTPSLSLDFERAARATAAAHYAIPEPQIDLAPAPEPATPASERRELQEAVTSNVIEFPRPADAPFPFEPMPYVEELAEPILDKPRILDAEEPPGLLFGGPGRPAITLESTPEPEAEEDARPAGEGPSLARRIFAAMLDSVLVAIATALFAVIFLHMADTLPHSRMALVVALGLPLLLWAMYQYLFLVHAAATPGMRAAGLSVRTFDNLPARRSLRRWRAIAMMVSGLALGLGFLWASIDEDGLCWHDRISRTVLRRT